jgi:hypothetical protein
MAFPDYELPDHTGRPRRLSEVQGDDPMIIVLAREAYSAKDQVQHEGLVQLWREMKPGVGYCGMVTITTTDPQEALNYRNGVGAEWPFLADPGRVVQRGVHRPGARPDGRRDRPLLPARAGLAPGCPGWRSAQELRSGERRRPPRAGPDACAAPAEPLVRRSGHLGADADSLRRAGCRRSPRSSAATI